MQKGGHAFPFIMKLLKSKNFISEWDMKKFV